MTVVRSGGSALFTGTAVLETEHTVHESVNVDEGAVHIDADDPEHVLRIKHSTGDGVDIFAAVDKDSGVKTAFIDSSGGCQGRGVGTKQHEPEPVRDPYSNHPRGSDFE